MLNRAVNRNKIGRGIYKRQDDRVQLVDDTDSDEESTVSAVCIQADGTSYPRVE